MTFLHIKTPCIYSVPLSKKTDKDIWLKMDCYQPTGSYKIRGIGRLCQHYFAAGKHEFVCSSGGNAGLAVAYSGFMLGAKTSVFIPKTSSPIFIERIKALGANVIVHGQYWEESNEAALDYCHTHDGAYIPPFDHPVIWAGHSTLVDELIEQGIKPDAVVASIGGGGLASGIIAGLKDYGLSAPLIGVEAQGAAVLHTCKAEGKLRKLTEIDTIATSLASATVTSRIWDYLSEHEVHLAQASDLDMINAIESFLDDHLHMVEPSSGAALSLVYKNSEILKPYQTIVVVACGGLGVSPKQLHDWKKDIH